MRFSSAQETQAATAPMGTASAVITSILGVAEKSPRWRTSRGAAGADMAGRTSGSGEKRRNATYYDGRVAGDNAYERLLAFRNQLRRFDQWSRQAAAEHGLTHAQHQLLLAVRGHTEPGGPSIGEVAEDLLVKHHTASGLVDRTEAIGLVRRVRDERDQRRVKLRLTERGNAVLEQLTEVHREELRRLARVLDAV